MGGSFNWQSGRTLSQSASFMFDNQIATDITFKFSNTTTTVEAHRFVLMARSYVFYFMFDSCVEKSGLAIEISDIRPSIFKEFLTYLYTDETTLSAETALQLTYCAEKYEVTDLTTKCMDYLQKHVNQSTLAMVLDHAVIHKDEALISTCRDIIAPLESWSCLQEHHVTKEALELVLGIQGLVVREVTLFEFCSTWAELECTFRNIPVNGSNTRKILGPLLGKIPFCSMTLDEFATNVSGKDLLNSQEELQIFRYFCAADKSNPPFPCKAKTLPKETLPLPCKSKKVCNPTDCKLNTNETTHKAKDITHTTNDTIHRANDIIHTTNDIKHTTNGITHATNDITHTTYGITHATNDINQTSNAITHMTNDSKYTNNDITHTNKDITHMTNDITLPLAVSSGDCHSSGDKARDRPNWKLTTYRVRHTIKLNCAAVSPDGSLCALGRKDGQVRQWDVQKGKHLYILNDEDSMSFCPSRYWLCAATGPSIKVWDLESKAVINELKQSVDDSDSQGSQCICINWSADGERLYAGYSDNIIRVWQMCSPTYWKLKTNCIAHIGNLSCVAASPDGSLCASGDKDGGALLWDLTDGKLLDTFSGADTINAICFSPNRYWLCAATGPSIKVWDLEGKVMIDELRQEVISSEAQPPQCISLTWSKDGQTLYAGYTDDVIHAWQLS